MVNEKSLRKLDIILLVLFPIISTTLSLSLKTNFLISILLFFVLPSVWLTIRLKQNIRKSLIFSLIVSLPATLVIDSVAVINRVWLTTSLFSFRLLGIVSIEQFLWGFLFVYVVVVYYQHFFDRKGSRTISKRMKYLIYITLILLSVFFVLFHTSRELLNLKYCYFIGGGIIYLLPIIGILFSFPNLILKFVKTQIYFTFLSILFELTALKLGHWTFPGTEFIGWVDLSIYKIPFEELFFYLILGAIGVLTYYEFFTDDRK